MIACCYTGDGDQDIVSVVPESTTVGCPATITTVLTLMWFESVPETQGGGRVRFEKHPLGASVIGGSVLLFDVDLDGISSCKI